MFSKQKYRLSGYSFKKNYKIYKYVVKIKKLQIFLYVYKYFYISVYERYHVGINICIFYVLNSRTVRMMIEK